MKTLIIGGTGVISTSIVDALNASNHNVTVFNRGFRPVRYKQKVNAIYGDKKDKRRFFCTMKPLKFDCVIDMISYNENDAADTLNAFDGEDTHFIFTSTTSTYKRPTSRPIIETDALCDTDDINPYGFHKANMEHYLNQKSSEGVKITIIRPSLTYGIGCRNIGPMRNNYGIVKRIQENKPVVNFGDGTNPWAWTFAPDLAKAYVGAMGREKCYGQTYHATSYDIHIWDDLFLGFGHLIGVEPKILHMSTEMLMLAAPEQFLHVSQEKMYSGIFDNSKIKRDIPEFVCGYSLYKILKSIYSWYMSDSRARTVDEKLDKLEDSLVDKYYKCVGILRG
ncbi:MAG: NAD-dependent epimerase/dehydratase family protein [Clostridiales bacterium]|jgi:nucleoside-diphosphate-sugar epimerase|nr:NAD-dependent epimerase/dehydratase family protein [Clostridiales bacterium]